MYYKAESCKEVCPHQSFSVSFTLLLKKSGVPNIFIITIYFQSFDHNKALQLTSLSIECTLINYMDKSTMRPTIKLEINIYIPMLRFMCEEFNRRLKNMPSWFKINVN